MVEPEVYFDPNEGYIINPKAVKKDFKLGKSEILHILIAWLGITFAFSWRGFSGINAMLKILPIILIATGTGFIFHELAHKFAAIYYGAKAQFRMWPLGLGLAILMALTLGFVFAAPGAVYIWGKNITRKENGIISLAGPFANFVTSIISIIILLFITNNFWIILFSTVAYVNAFLGIFNLIPIPPLDGSKVFVWNKLIWLFSVLAFIGIFIILAFI